MSTRTLSCLLLLTLALPGCIKRNALPAVGPGGASPDVQAALAAANARIGSAPRVQLLQPTGLAAFRLFGQADKVEMTPLPVEGLPFAEAARLHVKSGSGHEWAVQLQAANHAAIEAGDVLLATFYLRTEVPQRDGVGMTSFVFELGRSPYTKMVEYPVEAGPEWTPVQIRFQSNRAFAAGEASLIFRLGYEAQTLGLGGVKVENFGKSLPLSSLPQTRGSDRRRAKVNAARIAAAEAKTLAGPPVEGGALEFDVAPDKVIRRISPYVYGINSQPDAGVGATVRRMGGNRQTAYNWENNASNAGSDYRHSSDEWPCSVLGYKNCSEPGGQFVSFALANRALSVESLVTIPMVDYVTADKLGSVSEAERAPSPRFWRSHARKPGPLSLSPDLGDGQVYQDEFVNLLVNKLGRAAAGGIKFYSLDNEPALWASTHPRVHPDKTTYREIVERSEGTALAILRQDPTAFVLGGVMFGWSEYMSLQGAPDAAAHGTYLDFFLTEMKRLEGRHGQRLVHALDIHWYPEAMGAKRVTAKDVSMRTVAARVQAPRSLWDPTYLEKSWIASELGKPIRLIPWMLEKIAAFYPGTLLTLTEYNFGTGDHISGGLAQADALGIFGREGMHMANYWGDGAGNAALPAYIQAAFRLFRNHDGKRGRFGDTAVVATPADLGKASIYAATDSQHPGTLTLIVINKELHTVFDGKIRLGGRGYSRAEVYAFDGSGPEIRALAPVAIKNGRLEHRLAPLSATLFVCRK